MLNLMHASSQMVSLCKLDNLFQFNNHTYLAENYSFSTFNTTCKDLNINKHLLIHEYMTDAYMWLSYDCLCSTRYLILTHCTPYVL